MPLSLTVVIVDDQRLARARLRDLLADLPDVQVAGEARDGPEALELIRRTRPDVALLDIQMPGISGLQVARTAEPRPRIIFTTAYDRFAIAAFELNAVDYLLKPFGGGRLRAALERAREALASGATLERLARLAAALDRRQTPPMDRVFVQERGRVIPVALAEVERLQAERDYVAFYVGKRAHLARVSLADLLERLPDTFVRVHRSHAVNLAFVRCCEPLGDSRLEITLASGAQVTASRAGSRELRQRLRLSAPP